MRYLFNRHSLLRNLPGQNRERRCAAGCGAGNRSWAAHSETGIPVNYSASTTPVSQVCGQGTTLVSRGLPAHEILKHSKNHVLDSAAAPWRTYCGACSCVNLPTQPTMGGLPAPVSPCTAQCARVDLFCFVLRAPSQLGDVREHIGWSQSMRATNFVCYRYLSHTCSSSQTQRSTDTRRHTQTHTGTQTH